MELNANLVFVIGVAASFLVIVFRLAYEAAAKRGLKVPDWAMILIVYAASLLLAVVFFPQALPPLPALDNLDPVAISQEILSFVGQLLLALTAYSTAASAIYVVLLQKVKDGLGEVVAPAVYKKS